MDRWPAIPTPRWTCDSAAEWLWDSAIEANFRHSDRNQVDAGGTTDPDTGGSIVYVTPRLLFDAGGGWVLRASAQIPLSDSGLNGTQDEKIVVNLGVTRLFKP